MFGVKYGGKIYVSRNRTGLSELIESFGKDFMGNPLAIVEVVSPPLLKVLEKDGYVVLFECEKCEMFVDRTYGVDAEDFLAIDIDENPPVRYICRSCVRG